jgi:hypothetical protein
MLNTEKDIRKKNPLEACLIKNTLVEVMVNWRVAPVQESKNVKGKLECSFYVANKTCKF